MIRRTRRLEEFERRWAATHLASLSFDEALAIFASLWREAEQLRLDVATDWREDVRADIELARVLNGLAGQP
jgi:hypothetical protein